MNQATFNFAPRGKRADLAAARNGAKAPVRGPVAANDADPGDALGFDYARFGMVPPAPCLWPGHPIREGWERGRRLMTRRTRPATLAVTRWLALRLAAWQRGEGFDDHQITPQVLRSLEAATHCPITGRALGNDAVVVPVDVQRGWAAGNLMLVSPAIAERWAAIDYAVAKDALARAEAEPDEVVDGLALRHWRRVVALKSLATPLPHAEAAGIPLLVLPPNRLRLVNPIQELQAVLTLQLSVPGWGQRARTVADSLPETLRTEFNLFFNSLLAQSLRQGAGGDKPQMRDALAAAWGNEVVMRRWLRFTALVDADLAATLVDRLTHDPMPGLVVVRHGNAAAAVQEPVAV